MGWVTLALKKKLALTPVHFTSSQAGRQRRTSEGVDETTASGGRCTLTSLKQVYF